MDIHLSSLKDFIMPKVKSAYVTDYYEGIQGLLSSREEFPYNDFFANPRVRTKTNITWASDAFTKEPTLLNSLPLEERNNYSLELKRRILELEGLITLLQEEGVKQELVDLLNKAIANIDENSVYCGEGKIAVVNWGMIPRTASLGFGSIYRQGKFQGRWVDIDKAYRTPHAPSTPQKEPTALEPEVNPAIPDVTEIDTEKEIFSEPEPPVTSDEIHPTEKPSATVQNATPQPSVHPTPRTPEVNKPLVTSETPTVDPVTPENPVNNPEKKIEPVNKKDDRPTKQEQKKETWGGFFTNFSNGIKFLLRKLWWLILLLIIITITLFLLRHYQGPLCLVNPFFDPMPENPRVLPVDGDAIGKSADGYSKIATDRLNVVLTSDNEDEMLKWADKFKREYYTSDYRIFYFNKDLNQLQITVPKELHEQVKKEIYDKIPDIKFEVFDEPVYTSDEVQFNDPGLSNQEYAWYLQAIGAFDAWNVTTGDSDVVVAIVDNGFDMTHPEFKGKIVHPYNVVTGDENVRPVITSHGEDFHGTHVAATAVGNCNNNSGILGIAPKCRFMPVQVGNDNPQGCMSNQAVLEGVLYAISQGADVINLSLGITAPREISYMSESQQLNIIFNSFKMEELLWNKIIDKARKANCIIVYAAGNENVISGFDPQKRNSGSIIVSAVDKNEQKASFSNYGRYPQLGKDYSTLSAPGVGIYSAAPHDKYVCANGTSMAAPVVTGAVALLKSRNKNITVDQAKQILQQTGTVVNPKIGPLINLAKALGAKKSDKNCEAIADEVARLRARIDSLCQICPDAGMPDDTLKYDKAAKGKHGMDGTWKSTTSLVATGDNSPVTIYMEFHGSNGTLTMYNHNKKFLASLNMKVKSKKIYITQLNDAACTTTSDKFYKYSYVCSADRQGYFVCYAKNSNNSFSFNLTRVK